MKQRESRLLVLAAALSASAVLTGVLARSDSFREELWNGGFSLTESAGLVSLYDRAQLDPVLRRLDLDGEPADTAPDRPDMVVIVLDTLRRDRLETFGHPVDTMPRLERWAERLRVKRSEWLGEVEIERMRQRD